MTGDVDVLQQLALLAKVGLFRSIAVLDGDRTR